MHPVGILVGPQRSGDPVDSPQDLPGLSLALLEQVLKVAGWLMQVQHDAKAVSAIGGALALHVVGHDVDGAPGQFGAVVGPDALAPVPVVAFLGGEEVEQGVAVAGVAGGDGFGQDPLVEQ